MQACQVSRIAHVTHAIDSLLTWKTGLFSHKAWSWDMASSFTNIRDCRIKMPCALYHYLLYISSRWGPTSVMVHALLESCASNYVELPHSLGGLLETIIKVRILILLFST